MFSIAELPVSDLSVGQWGAGIWYKTEKPMLGVGMQIINCKTTAILGEDIVTGTPHLHSGSSCFNN